MQELCKLMPEWLEVRDIGMSGRFVKVLNPSLSSVRVHDLLRERILGSSLARKVKN